jgi:hypothetical protein
MLPGGGGGNRFLGRRMHNDPRKGVEGFGEGKARRKPGELERIRILHSGGTNCLLKSMANPTIQIMVRRLFWLLADATTRPSSVPFSNIGTS